MRPTTLLLLSHLLTLSSPTPLASSLHPRTQYCLNAPTVKAGSLLPRTPLPPGVPQVRFVGPFLWCAHASQTYIITTISSIVPGPAVQKSLTNIYNGALAHIHRSGDGPLPSGVFVDNDPITQISVSITNADNHQTTWGVFAAALTALEECMKSFNVWGEAMFHVYDGMNLVGSGEVALFGRESMSTSSLNEATGSGLKA